MQIFKVLNIFGNLKFTKFPGKSVLKNAQFPKIMLSFCFSPKALRRIVGREKKSNSISPKNMQRANGVDIYSE